MKIGITFLKKTVSWEGKYMKKSYKSVLLFFVLLFSLSGLVGCTRNERINAAEFERRLTKYDERCAFFDGEVFYRKPTYYTYYSFACERDVLLTVRHDKYGRVDRVTVTADAESAADINGAFALVCSAAAYALLPSDCDIASVLSAAGLFDVSSADNAGFSEFTAGKTSFWVFRGRGSVTFAADVNKKPEN